MNDSIVNNIVVIIKQDIIHQVISNMVPDMVMSIVWKEVTIILEKVTIVREEMTILREEVKLEL